MPSAQSAIDWASGYSLVWRVATVDPRTWADNGVLAGVTAAKVTRDSSLALLESGSVDVDGEAPVTETWCRIEVLAEQAGVIERHPVATLLLTPAPSKARRGGMAMTLDGRSVLTAADERMLAGSYVPRGADGAAWAAQLLEGCTPAPIVVDGSFALADHVVYERRTTRLEAARMLLDAGGWVLQVEPDGTIRLGPPPDTPALEVGPGMIGKVVEVDDGAGDVPNRVVAWSGGEEGRAEDTDPSRPTSYANRNRWVDVVDERPSLLAGETVQAYAERRLAELAATTGTRGYERAWVPGITTGDMLLTSVPAASLVGRMRVVAQEISIGKGMSMSETVEVCQ